MTNITLNGTAAVQIQQGTAAGFSLQNNGPGNVYLGNDASVSPSTGYVVQPGVSLPLNANAVLYGCTDNGQTAAIQLLQGATATQATIVEANVPNAVNVSGSVEITNATVPVSGNVAITNASIPVSGNVGITGGSISVSGSSVSVSGNVPTLASNHPTFLSSTPFNAPATAGSGNLSLGGYYTTGYASMILAIIPTATNPYTDPPAVANYFTAQVQQSINGTGNVVDMQLPQWLMNGTMYNMIQVPVIGDQIVFTMSYNKAATAGAMNALCIVYGTNEVIDAPRYVHSSSNMQGNIPFGQVYALNMTANHTDYVSTKNGDASFNIYGAGSTSDAVIYVSQSGATKGIAALYTGSGVNGQFQSLKLPMLPILVQNSVSAGTAVVALSQ